MDRTFLVTKPNSNRTSCFICHHPVTKQEIRISFLKYDHYRYFHLPCFEPTNYHYIRQKDLDIRLTEESDIQTVQAWRSSWNLNFFPLDPEIPITVTTNKVLRTKTSNLSQVFVLVFRFLTISELVEQAELVCKSFYHASWDNQLWKYLMLRDFNIETKAKGSRKNYTQENLERCVKCKTKTDLKRCELIERNICKLCKKSIDKYEFVRNDAKTKFGIDPAKLGLRYKCFDGRTKYYPVLYINKRVPLFRKENKARVLRMLTEILPPDSEFIQIVQEIDIDHMENPPFGYFLSRIKRDNLAYNEKYEQIHSYKLVFDYIRRGKFKQQTDTKALNSIKSELTPPTHIYH